MTKCHETYYAIANSSCSSQNVDNTFCHFNMVSGNVLHCWLNLNFNHVNLSGDCCFKFSFLYTNFSIFYHWWLVELPYWFKASFDPKIIGILTMHYAKYNFVVTDCVVNPHSVTSTHTKWFQPILNDFAHENRFTSHQSDSSLLDISNFNARVISVQLVSYLLDFSKSTCIYFLFRKHGS